MAQRRARAATAGAAVFVAKDTEASRCREKFGNEGSERGLFLARDTTTIKLAEVAARVRGADRQ